MGLILITHDLGVVADVADRIAVMYAGRIVEQAPVHDIYARPAHPYTKALLESIPAAGRQGPGARRHPGPAAEPDAHPAGCAFHPRCPYAQDVCRDRTRAAAVHGRRRPQRAACHFWKEVLGE